MWCACPVRQRSQWHASVQIGLRARIAAASGDTYFDVSYATAVAFSSPGVALNANFATSRCPAAEAATEAKDAPRARRDGAGGTDAGTVLGASTDPSEDRT